MQKLDVFISHISEENELAELLQKNITRDFLSWVNVFVSSDKNSIPVGENWLNSTDIALRQASILIVLCSRHSIKRPWINFESGAAWMNKIPIIPICHSGLSPADLPMPLSVLHAIEAHQAFDIERLYSRIANQLECDTPNSDYDHLVQQIEKLEFRYDVVAKTKLEDHQPESLDTILSPMEQAINEASLGWTLCFIGEDQSDKLAVLTADLRREFSDCGDGKQFASGFSYWGIIPTLAWARACNDHLYLVMKKSIEFFPERWNKIKTDILEPYHYVSLGVGTGTKDRRILRDLSRLRRDFYYFPVDMSPEMLRVGLKACLESEDIPRCKMLPIQIDFSVESNIFEIQRMLQRILGDEPILFSLLGNTLANFEEDNDLLETLHKLMRPQDRFLLEVATTALLDTTSINSAADEYIKSSAFKQFVTSAILQYTDLPAGLETVDFLVAIEGGKAIKIKSVYTNREGRTLPLKLPDNTTVDFLPDDTIRLYLTRKYTIDGINKLIKDTGFFPISNQHELQSREGFGIDLFLLKKVDI